MPSIKTSQDNLRFNKIVTALAKISAALDFHDSQFKRITSQLKSQDSALKRMVSKLGDFSQDFYNFKEDLKDIKSGINHLPTKDEFFTQEDIIIQKLTSS